MQQQQTHNFDMAKFLDFSIEASVLLETLHQNGLIHGQLCPTSFQWEDSSSLKTVTPPTSTSSSTSSTSDTLASSPSISRTDDRPKHFQTHPSRRDNHTSPSQLTLDRGALAKTTNASKRKQRRYSLVLDCTHLGLGDKTAEPTDSPARKGLRDHHAHHTQTSCTSSAATASSALSSSHITATANAVASSSSSPSSTANNNGNNSTTAAPSIHPLAPSSPNAFTLDTHTHTNANYSTPYCTAGSLADPTLFSPSDANLQPYSTTTSHGSTVIHDAIAARVARIKRSLLPSSSSSSSSSPAGAQSPLSTPPSSSSSSASAPTLASTVSSSPGGQGSSQPLVLKKHFLLHVPQELHSPPGCVLPVQIDIYALGVMFYYLLTSHTTLQPEDLAAAPPSMNEKLNSMATGNGSTAVRGAHLPTTPARLASIIQRMVAKSSKDRFLSMIQVRKELTLIRDQEQDALKRDIELHAHTRTSSENGMPISSAAKPPLSLPALSSSYTSVSSMPRPTSPTNSTVSIQSTSSQDPDAGSRRSASISHPHEGLSPEDRAFVLESVLSLSHITNLQEMLPAISQALDNVLVVHPPEEMAIILWQKDDHLPNGGTWAIIEDKYQPGTTQSALSWTDLSERRDHMPVLVRKALDTKEHIFSTAVGSRSQLPTIACVPIILAAPTSSLTSGKRTCTSGSSSAPSSTSTLVGALYLHHLHPRFYFSKRDQDMLILFCQKLASSLLQCEKIAGLEKQLSLATQRNRFLEDTIARIQKNEHEVFSWMEALPCFVWAAERDDVASRQYLSRSWFDFTGLPGDTRTSDRWISAMHPDDVASFQKEVSQSYKTGVYKDCEFRLMRYDGVYRWHLSRAIPVLNHSGAILKWIGVTIDIDDLYLAQKAELHKKSNFLANMSHELRTPFSGFHGMLTLLGYSSLDEEQKECVETAKDSCEKLLMIIDDLLDFSKLEADKVTLEASPFDLEEVFEEVEEIVKPLAFKKSLEVAFCKNSDVPDILIGDCNRLKQILLNLVGNAIKFTHSGHVLVECKVLDRDTDLISTPSAGMFDDDDDKFYFRHEKNGGGQCQSEIRPPNSGRFSSPEPLSESSIKLMISVTDTGIGISPEEQAMLFSPFSQVDGSATRSYGGSGLGLSICLQLVRLMKGRIGLNSDRDKGSKFWFVIQCEKSNLPEATVGSFSETEVGDSTKEIKRITRTLGTPRILIASTSETTIKSLQSYLVDCNTEVANLPSTAVSRLEESVANGFRFDFVCWDFPKYDPQHETLLELKARPELNNVHFVLLYTPATDIIKRAQSLQHPPSTSSLAVKRRPMLSQSISLRVENSGSSPSGPSVGGTLMGSEVPGLSPEKLNSLRITCISKPIRRLKLLRAFVEILDDSAKKCSVATNVAGAAAGTAAGTSAAGATPSVAPSSPTASNATALGSPISSPTNSITSSATLSPTSMTRSPSLSMLSSLEGALGKEVASNPGASSSTESVPSRPDLQKEDSGSQFLSRSLEQATISQTQQGGATESSGKAASGKGEGAGAGTGEVVTVLEREIAQPVAISLSKSTSSLLAAADVETGDKDPKENGHLELTPTASPQPALTPPVSFLRKSKSPSLANMANGGSGTGGRLKSNSPKPSKTSSKLVTDEASEISLSREEAARITGMRILLAEDNEIAQKVLSKQLAMFGLVISCANDGVDALALFKSHPRGYFTLGFFDHHMPNCDGVQATQQIRALEKEHAAEVKGPVPRLPVVAVSADIQETARKACLNSGMERYVTKPLMQRDLVEMVRHYCVIGDAVASTHAYVPPPEGTMVTKGLDPSDAIMVTSTVEAMVSAGHVSAPIGSNANGSLTPMKAATLVPKRDVELSPAALRGLALIRGGSLQEESSKAGGGVIKSSSTTTTTSTTASLTASTTNLTLPSMPTCASAFATTGCATTSTSTPANTTASTGQHLVSAPVILGKSNSSSSLAASYHNGSVNSLPGPGPGPMVLTSVPLTMASYSSGTITSSASVPAFLNGCSTTASTPPSLSPDGHAAHGSQSPIAAAMAAGAAAAVAAASAAVNTMSSALAEHIHPPSIYAAHHHQQQLLFQQQQKQQQHIYQQQLQQQLVQQQQLAMQGQGQGPVEHVYHPAQQVFVPFLHPCEPSPMDPMFPSKSSTGMASPLSTEEPLRANCKASEAGPTTATVAAAAVAGGAPLTTTASFSSNSSLLTNSAASTAAAAIAGAAPVQLNSWL
ncbi:hypothetical protein EMPS_08427 [Entomortierella parvispora]|uniref:Histidine kinase n=1 Tax=Entomortierella parvispora TaxID=205924 RepID=A0A9P3HGN1_9FUNG|nr:hypothetical protein EMPS_08427 [Entomortierella parvispora]